MNLQALIALLGFIPLAVAMFLVLSPRRAVLAGYMIAWLFLPMAALPIRGLPDIDKILIATFGIGLGILIFDLNSVLTLRPRWADLVVLVFCLCPVVSSVTNGLGWYDGGSSAFMQTLRWGVPYVIGRMYFKDAAAMKDLMMAIIIAAMVYVPLCWFEVRMSPQLHQWVYGSSQGMFSQKMRDGGYRPAVFMQNSLVLVLFMTLAAVTSFAFWRGRVRRFIANIPIAIIFAALVVTVVLCKTMLGYVILLVGCAAFWFCRRYGTALPILAMLILPTLYIGVRGAGVWDGTQLGRTIMSVSPARGESLAYRIKNETQLADRARGKMLFGWGGWGRGRVFDDSGKDISVTDGYWIIIFGDQGVVGLCSMVAIFVLSTLRGLRAAPPSHWKDPQYVPIAAAILMVIFAYINNIPNADANPLVILAIGGLISLAVVSAKARVRVQAVAARGVPHARPI